MTEPTPPQIGTQTAIAMRALMMHEANARNAVEGDVRGLIVRCLREHPMTDATRRQVALHEAGHLLAYEVEGLVALKANIHGSPYGRGGWSGKAWPANELCIGPRDWQRWGSPNDLLREARMSFAGPWAEFFLGGGDIASSIGELVESHILAAQAADLLGRDPRMVVDEVVAGTRAIVAEYMAEIEEIADLLEREGPSKRSRRGRGVEARTQDANSATASRIRRARA
jgi:hypothetical protein